MFFFHSVITWIQQRRGVEGGDSCGLWEGQESVVLSGRGASRSARMLVPLLCSTLLGLKKKIDQCVGFDSQNLANDHELTNSQAYSVNLGILCQPKVDSSRHLGK